MHHGDHREEQQSRPRPAEAEDEQQEESTVTLKVDGKEVALKQSEVIELAQKGFDYTNKTMAVAEERKAVEQAREQAEQYRQRNEQAVQQNLAALQAFERFTAAQLGDPPPIEWAQQDASYYLAQKEQYEARKGQLQQAQTAIQHLQGEAALRAGGVDRVAQRLEGDAAPLARRLSNASCSKSPGPRRR